jgi:small subunit ribosomal protein S8
MGRKGVAVSDPLSDLFTRLRNGQRARLASVSLRYSRFAISILDLLVREGYLLGVRVIPPASPRAPQYNTLEAFLKYDPQGRPSIKSINRVSIPSRKVVTSIAKLPVPKGGLASWILTTPKGVMTCAQARANRVGGEIIGIVE